MKLKFQFLCFINKYPFLSWLEAVFEEERNGPKKGRTRGIKKC